MRRDRLEDPAPMDRGRRMTLLVLSAAAASSAAGLMFEVALTRFFAVTQFYHFAFLAVSLALLGFGASGSALAVRPTLAEGGLAGLRRMAAAQSLASLGAYLVVNTLPFDSFSVAWDRTQILLLAVYYLVLAVPFFFGGLLIASLLANGDAIAGVRSNHAYAASLSGSGVGAIAALAGLDLIGGEGTIVLSAGLAMVAATAMALTEPNRRRIWTTAVATTALLALGVWIPQSLEMNLSPYKGLSGALRYPGATVTDTTWELGTRIDLVSSDGIRSLPGLSLQYGGDIPPQDGITFDGDDLSPIVRSDATHHSFASWMLSSVAFEFHHQPRVLVLEPHGGLDVAIALAGEPHSVTVVEQHPATVELVRRSGTSPYDDRRVTVNHATSRTFMERTQDRYDVIDLALTAPYRPVASGAYSLAEDYRLTVEAFETYFEHLTPDGNFVAMRWVQVPPSEEMRLLATAAAALRNLGYDPGESLAMLRSYSSAVVMARPAGFDAPQLQAIEEFARTRRFDIVVAPGEGAIDPNRFNVVPDERYSSLAADLVSAGDPDDVFGSHEFEISPPTDDHPFFGHYFKWSQAPAVIESLGRTWQPFGGAGYLVLIALLVISTLMAVVLIVAPVAIGHRRRATSNLRWWTLGYFSMLGIGFLFVEIPLIQRLILLIGDPAASFAIVLFAILVSSGVGSSVANRIPWRGAAVALTLASVAYPFVVSSITEMALPASTPARIAAAILTMLPLGFLMGTMFPKGIALLEEHEPGLIPWAWAINGTVSVVSTAGAAVLALTFGFSTVLYAGAGAYALAAVGVSRRRG